MTRYGLRVGPDYPFPKYRGDVIHLGNSTREQVEEIRGQMATGEFHEVVELDENGQVIDRAHRLVTTVDEGRTERHYCLDCETWTTGGRLPALPCPGVKA